MELEIGRWYVGRAGILKSVVFRIVVKSDNGMIEIVTAKPFEHKMSFPLLELRVLSELGHPRREIRTVDSSADYWDRNARTTST